MNIRYKSENLVKFIEDMPKDINPYNLLRKINRLEDHLEKMERKLKQLQSIKVKKSNFKKIAK